MPILRHDRPHRPGEAGPLHADRLGDRSAPVLVFVHGITGSRRYFRGRVGPLAANHRVIIPDLPGFGLSPKPHVDYTPLFFRDSLRRFLEDEGIAGRPHVLVGHSLGAIIACEYAAAWPEEVPRLVLFNLPRYNSPEEAHRVFWLGSPNYRKLLGEDSVSENLAQLRRTGIDLFLRYALRFPFAVYADCRKFTLRSLTSTLWHSLLSYSVDDVLDRLKPLPILMVHGQRDQVAPIENVRPILPRFPFIRMDEIADSGHHVFLTHTRTCLNLIEAFEAQTAAAIRSERDASPSMSARRGALRAAPGEARRS